MRGRWHISERWTTHDQVDVAEANEIGQVLVATGKLLNMHSPTGVQPRNLARRKPIAEPLLQAHPVELLTLSNGLGIERVPHTAARCTFQGDAHKRLRLLEAGRLSAPDRDGHADGSDAPPTAPTSEANPGCSTVSSRSRNF